MWHANLCNTLWMATCYREARAYEVDSQRVRPVQAALLRQIVRRNGDTWFGRKHRFAAIRTVRDFQNAVPLTIYDDYRDGIERIADGEQYVLTADRVHLLEPTGGSTLGEKLVPYTPVLARSFRRALGVWIWDLYSRRPAARRGRSYWSISPMANAGRRTKAGIPIGFADDAAYLGRWERRLVARTLIVPPAVAQCPSIAAARYATLFFLLRAADLSLVSVWSPTFLTELLHALWERRDELCDDIAAGQITADSTNQRNPVAARSYRPLAERAAALRQVFRGVEHVSQCVRAVWPSLALVSCWADGPSSVHAANLRQNLPGIELQPKGLLATEAFVTVPLLSEAAPALAFRSHFFEFQPASADGYDASSRLLLADELYAGRRYRVVVTNGGGLYRYQLHDEVEVAGFKGGVPLLRFVGKADDISDLVGEKLNAAHVEAVLRAAFLELRIAPTFAQLRAEPSSRPGYVLRIVAPGCRENPVLQERLCQTVEGGLGSNPGYRYARAVDQLGPLRVELLDQRQADAISSGEVLDRVAAGQRWGDIKPATLCWEAK